MTPRPPAPVIRLRLKIHHPVGAGHAPPATKRQRETYGYSVGAAYMPPAAAIPSNQPNGQTARDAFMRPLQTCRKFAFCQSLLAFRLFVGRGLDPSLLLCGDCQFPRRGGVTPPYGAIKIHRAVGAGHCPARGITFTKKIMGWFVGAACMPPVAVTPVMRYNG